MAAEAQRAPRVASERTNMASAAAARMDLRTAAAKALTDYDLNRCRPFGCTPVDSAISFLEQAHALTIALSIAVGDEDESGLRNVHARGAIDAIGTLVALAAFMNESAS